ncbi:Abortive infection C-terminus [Rheinheimera pacifica]|uniref:Abortive infection C-terminus n=1 Tax=Rheinheimera pacifica TaxID=173990 RepID=A0A1H6LD51_9GAMM|nr:abortive infection family protein [Rheinheimera pacifica]SEH83139.1 Abortive infection C-terminus [Rheinheimera pacifica]
MPLQMASELRFPMGSTTPLSEQSVDDFISLIRRVSGGMSRQGIIEVFKQHFCKVSGDYYARSSSIDWAESDMSSQAQNAAKDAPNFIAAVYEALEELEHSGATVPTVQNINQILLKNQDHYQIVDDQLTQTAGSVAAPEFSESISTSVMRALGDAKALIGTVDSSSAIDRAHTALHGYLVQLCIDNQIDLPNDPTASKAFKQLRQFHPALQASGHRADEVTRVLNSFAASIDAFSTLRNKASLAHVNDLLDVPEATAIVNAMYTVFRYIQDCIKRMR